MEAKQVAYNAGRAFHRDPMAAVRTFVFLLLAFLILFLVWKVAKGFGNLFDRISDQSGTSVEDKGVIASDPEYQDAMLYLDDQKGIVEISKVYNSKTKVSDYMAQKGLTWPMFTTKAEAIWNAKWPGYIDGKAVIDAVAALPSKAAVSLMAYQFNQIYSKLWNGSKLDTFLTKYMNAKEIKAMADVISKKPVL